MSFPLPDGPFNLLHVKENPKIGFLMYLSSVITQRVKKLAFPCVVLNILTGTDLEKCLGESGFQIFLEPPVNHSLLPVLSSKGFRGFRGSYYYINIYQL